MRWGEWLQYAEWLVLILPFWFCLRLLKKRQKDPTRQPDYNETWTKGYV